MRRAPDSRPPLGQHFLHNTSVVQAIVRAAELKPGESALEIGPGKGVLTSQLLPKVKRLVAVELDRSLARDLQERWPSCEIVMNDFLKVDLNPLFPEAERPIKVLGNLPYAVTSPIFEKLLAWPGWECGVFLIQREVADRMRSDAGSKAFGILTLAVQLFATVERILVVQPGSFNPPPRVVSAVIRLRRLAQPRLTAEDVPAFFDLAHAAFGHRRKTIANSMALATDHPKEIVEKWLFKQSVDPRLRAEALSVEEYVRLAPAWGIFRRETNLT